MLIEDESTWPASVLRFIQTHEALLDDWYGPSSEARVKRQSEPGYHGPDDHAFGWQDHDHALAELIHLIHPHTLESGFHSTRLTDLEVAPICQHGMQLQNGASLRARIRALESAGLISATAAAAFAARNSADDRNRAAMIWFCFFPPHRAGASGVGCFFRYWGGEALYRWHDTDAERGTLLQRIGTPCIVVADVPCAQLSNKPRLVSTLARRYFYNRGASLVESMDHEDFTAAPLPAATIRRIVRFPAPEFLALTGCETWPLPLQ